MDRFERALERARRDRPKNVPPVPQDRTGGDTVNREPSNAAIQEEGPLTPVRNEVEPRLPSNSLVALDYSNPVADLFRILRTQVLKALTQAGVSTMGVCSARSGEGKTFVAANIAASLALSQEQSVLLIDLDLRRPGVHKQLQMPGNPGITDFLARRVSLPECVRKTSIKGLELLSAGSAIRNSSEALGSSVLATAFAEITNPQLNRITICDLPPLLSSDDALKISAKLGGVLLVVEEGRTRPADIQRSLDLLSSTKLFGTVLNKSRRGASFHYAAYYGQERE